MFRSVFAKYIAVFMTILLLSFGIVILIVASIVGNYSEDLKRESMSNAAEVTVSYLEGVMLDEEVGNLNDYLSAKHTTERFLEVITSVGEDMTVILTDRAGNILLAKGNEAEEVPVGSAIPKRLTDKVLSG